MRVAVLDRLALVCVRITVWLPMRAVTAAPAGAVARRVRTAQLVGAWVYVGQRGRGHQRQRGDGRVPHRDHPGNRRLALLGKDKGVGSLFQWRVNTEKPFRRDVGDQLPVHVQGPSGHGGTQYVVSLVRARHRHVAGGLVNGQPVHEHIRRRGCRRGGGSRRWG
jgi:hypothetical protein